MSRAPRTESELKREGWRYQGIKNGFKEYSHPRNKQITVQLTVTSEQQQPKQETISWETPTA